MTAREQLMKEIEQISDAIVEEVLDFCLFVKQRQQSRAAAVRPETSEYQTGGILELLENVKEIQAQVPKEEWDKLPHDGSINHDHYLYGAPKVVQE
ncbi:MAG: hypothetical protein ACFBSF_00360 [Leptolyngbyaceae cyanobacterium]